MESQGNFDFIGFSHSLYDFKEDMSVMLCCFALI